ncbi:hypothetical protein RvY_16096 [Ramazzottius varieornatus]|uniref:G-protein coupled receptors family 1 profile domain-containing protein n=1 Tax=Ramazzottius varieornatus TaxID=947166 RepID=A0A1D1VX88_RAMVA|nr:hypothetical protein RvY_16096 [Ramazzottius varieornatus]
MGNNTTFQLTNSTSLDGPNWTFTPCSTLFIQISAILGSGSIPYLFVRDRTLLTPFTIYVANLFVANLGNAFLFYSIEMINDVYSVWWMGHAACTYHNYTSWIFGGAMYNSHALIALNRLWAVTFPVSYRRYHRKRFALGVCAATWIYLHAGFLPGIIQDASWYRLPGETNSCQVNGGALQVFAWTTQILMYDLPEVVVISVYPVICYKTWKRRRAHNVRPSASGHTGHGPSGTAVVTSHGVTSGTGPGARLESRQVNYGFLSLTLMTMAVFICYTPAQVYYERARRHGDSTTDQRVIDVQMSLLSKADIFHRVWTDQAQGIPVAGHHGNAAIMKKRCEDH